jgi:hypothetical protein
MAFELLSEIAADPERFLWGWCDGKDGGPPCGHNARLNLSALILYYGDLRVDELRRRLKCPKCGGHARVVQTHSGRPA